MRPASRRKIDKVWLIVGALVAGAIAAIAALAGDTERIATHWAMAEIDPDGTATVTEVIDYDFGPNSRRGIFRDIPDLPPTATVQVDSRTAPDQFIVQPTYTGGSRIRIGDPNVTINNRHRYTIRYPLDTLVMGDTVSWNAVGTEWEVPMSRAIAHLITPYELTAVRCDHGSRGSTGGCTATTVEPGHVMVDLGYFGDHQGVTITGTVGEALASPPSTPIIPDGAADDPGSGWFLPALLAAVATIIGALIASPLIRRRGREMAYIGGPADVAFGDDSIGVQRLDYDELQEMATIEFAPPRDLSATIGGVIIEEDVKTHHKVAWLIESAIRDEVVLDGEDDDLTLRRGEATPDPAVGDVLDAMFAGRNEIPLGKYDKSFGAGWSKLSGRLDAWRASSELWDPEANTRRKKAAGFGVLAIVFALALLIGGGVISNRWGSMWLPVVVIGGILAGIGLALLVRGWELLVRTPQGTALWLQTESFRRFIHDSEAYHATQAAQMGYLREYTAWAVALDELDHWEDAVEEAAAQMGDSSAYRNDFAFVHSAPALAIAASSTSTKPSSSGGSGGGGGFSGGGGGGGGGGSW